MSYGKKQTERCLVTVYADKGSLAFRFSGKFNSLFKVLDGIEPSKQKTMGLGLPDTSANRDRAMAAAREIEADLLHRDWQSRFDPTFEQYNLKAKYAALKLAAPPVAIPEMTVGQMWEDYLIWKEQQLEQTTFRSKFQTKYTNALKGLVWNRKNQQYSQSEFGIWDLGINSDTVESALKIKLAQEAKFDLFCALNEAFINAQSIGKIKLGYNPFFAVLSRAENNKIAQYKNVTVADGETLKWHEVQDAETNAQERDCRAFTKEERDIIIAAFYEAKRIAARQIAPLVEFCFLTGCRPSEAFALTWANIKFEKGVVVFNKSHNGEKKITKNTKNSTIRWFEIYPKLQTLLLRIKPDEAREHDLVFKQGNGAPYHTGAISSYWYGKFSAEDAEEKYSYPGIVKQLADDGLISCYLSPYHTRHTFITLQARNGANLLMLAAICGNSVDVIQRSYLEVDKSAKPLDI
ncbi:tyrosine-type recombinase/integrase [Microcoleus sp. N3A4]|uniref:tyrosine-type recombinase/integrase n=1 Tax=Microcoleus sp. N3A4 TaxID=3055379 RepID=UPI002FD30F5C